MAGIQSKPLPSLTAKDIQRFWKHVDQQGGEDACWPWKGCKYRGYGHFGVARVGRTVISHRIAYFLGYSADPAPLYVLHHCDNAACCNPRHLWLGDAGDNMRDCCSKGRKNWKPDNPRYLHPERSVHGERQNLAKLKEADIVSIRALYASGSHRQIDLATMFGVRQCTIGKVINRNTWKHIVP